MAKDILLVVKELLSTEKSARAVENRTYVMRVGREYSKYEIKKAVELLYSVKVDDITSLNVIGKTKRFGRNMGKRNDWKKAYVKLKPGYSIEIGQA